MKRVSLLLGMMFFTFSIFAQNQDDEILFTIADEAVPVSEFLYIYTKNLGDKADFSKKSLKEYLDLYTKFKLKVKKAKSMKLDTSKSFKNEMNGYREQLAKSYLVDKEVNEKMIREAYDRMKKDLKVRMILISFSRDKKNESEVKNKIDNIYKELKEGKSFSSLARKYSDDRYSNKSGGDIGWVTAMLPNGFYEFENRIYNLKKGEFSKPFKTDYGYMIVKLEDERPARGEIEAAHILIRDRVKGKVNPKAKAKIDSLYRALQAGADFEKLAKKYSMDVKTAGKGGYLGFFGINKYESKFEDQAFALKKDNDISKPFKTSLGWHIIKRLSKPGIKPFEQTKRSLANEMNKNERYKIARKALIARIKKESGFKEYKNAFDRFAAKLDKSFYSFKWNIPEYKNEDLCVIGDKKYTLEDFVNYCKKNQRARLKLSKREPVKDSALKMYDKFIDDICIKYEEQHLEDKYPDFKFLMKEYTEGNLLFEVMEKEVWNKASKDTAGLKKFYENHKNNYKWKKRAVVNEYTIHTDNPKLIKKILKYSKKKSHKKLLKKFNKKEKLITFLSNKYEIGDKELEGIEFKVGTMTEPVMNKKKKTVVFKKIVDIIPESLKSLDDAKGYIIADYQEFLEDKWIKSLEKEYPVKINEKVFNKMIR